jgi:hypothetical protein
MAQGLSTRRLPAEGSVLARAFSSLITLRAIQPESIVSNVFRRICMLETIRPLNGNRCRDRHLHGRCSAKK